MIHDYKEPRKGWTKYPLNLHKSYVPWMAWQNYLVVRFLHVELNNPKWSHSIPPWWTPNTLVSLWEEEGKSNIEQIQRRSLHSHGANLDHSVARMDKEFPSRAFGWRTSSLTPLFQTSGLQKGENINFHIYKSLSKMLVNFKKQ